MHTGSLEVLCVDACNPTSITIGFGNPAGQAGARRMDACRHPLGGDDVGKVRWNQMADEISSRSELIKKMKKTTSKPRHAVLHVHMR